MRSQAALLIISLLAAAIVVTPSSAAQADTTYEMYFPVVGSNYYSDTFGAPRSGGRTHAGVDIIANKMIPVVAVADGTIYWMHNEVGGNCCAMGLRHDDNWVSYYVHLNNDTLNTDDGLGYGFVAGLAVGSHVYAGQLIGWVGDSGNAESTVSHLHFELHEPDGTVVNPTPHVDAATVLVAPLPPPPPDEDSDGVTDAADNCPANANPSQSDVDQDGIGDACDPIDNDPDRDGIFTATDNCPITPNPIQSDVDRDGIGDACDPVDDDPDRDGIFTATDNCSGVWNPEQFDTDGNGLGDECDPWDDVWIGHWARPAVDDVYAAGISLGCGLSPLRFCPDANVTRAEMAAFLIRGMGHDDHSASEPAGFTDVDGISWYADYVDHLAEHGVTTGCSADPLRFCPNRSVTRAEVAAFLAKALGHDLTSIEYTGRFIDVADGDWYMPAVEHLAAIGIINGYPDGSFDPSAPISRAEMAALLQRSFLTP